MALCLIVSPFDRGSRLFRWIGADAQLVEKGLVKSIGISNLNINRTKKILAECKIKPVASASPFPPREQRSQHR